MVEQQSDILVNIPDDQLPKLATLYQERAPWAPWIVNFVQMTIRWKKLEKYKDIITITSPKNSWKADGTIIAIMKLSRHNIIIFTLEEDCSNLYQGLMETELIDYNKRIMFYGVLEKHTPTVTKFLREKKLEIGAFMLGYFYGMSPEEAKNVKMNECPLDVYIRKLSQPDAKKIAVVWPHNYPGAESYVFSFIEANGGFGVFFKSTNEPISWVLRQIFDNFGFLQTDEQYKKKGYGSLVCQALIKEIAQDGIWAVSTILRDNKPSIGLFEKIGFQNLGKCTFIALKF